MVWGGAGDPAMEQRRGLGVSATSGGLEGASRRGWKGSPRPRSITEDPTETPPAWRGLCPTRSTPNSCPCRAALIAWGILSVLGGTFVCGQSAALAVMGLLQ
ncbi:putative sodium-coupled neutral amino acid transporter 8 [Aix galericulata]|nr:putative sodium-coupled neutral amino acid transporter 8 [Aix galericulata]